MAASEIEDLGVTAQSSSSPQASGTGTSRSRRLSFAWTGLLPFFVYVFLFFLLPIGVILFTAFRKNGPKHRDPVTQQFVASKVFTSSNLSATLHGIYQTSMKNSIELSASTAVIGAVFGMFLAYAIVTSRSGALRQIVIAAAAVMANFGGIPLAFLFIATVGFPAGALTVLHRFTGGAADGANSFAPLILASDGNAYGTTARGGSADAGTLFRISR